MEDILGIVGDKPSKARAIVLRNNGIKRRYYAFRNGKGTHTNTEMAAAALRGLFDETFPIDSLELIAIGTSTPEQLIPSHAVMVHGQMGMSRPAEVISTAGVCCSGMQAMKYAYLSVGSGLTNIAASCGSERISTWMHASRFQPEVENLKKLEANPYIAFEKDFLRWMLSDGAGAALLQPDPAPEGHSLRIEWLEICSYAHELETCMYAGAIKNEDASVTGWNELSPETWHQESVFSAKQDTRLLGEHIVARGGQFLETVMKKHQLSSEQVDYFLPHMSSEFFRDQIQQTLKQTGLDIPFEKWFYNLPDVGNVGSASPYLMLEELFHSGRLRKGDRLLVMVPESARFSYAYLYLTVV
jgi:3-oxoacyl-[acyl-carrier-protein] synthase-3